jgi:hypothetical protein
MGKIRIPELREEMPGNNRPNEKAKERNADMLE